MFDYTGATNKVMVDSTGLAKWAPHNLLTYSEQFDNAAWSKTNATVTANAGTAPDGNATADLMEATASGAQAVLAQVSGTSGVERSSAIYVKRVNNDWFALSNNGFFAYFNLASATVGTVGEGSATITDVGSGWLRIVWSGQTNLGIMRIRAATADGDASVDGGEQYYIWGAHAYRSDLAGMASVPADERGLASDDTYVPTTTAARYLPRRDSYRYNGTSFVRKGLRLESEQRTNSCLHSRAFDNAAWTKGSGISVSANQVGIDGVSNTAYTVTKTGTGLPFLFQNATVANDSLPSAATYFVGKTVGATTFPGVLAFFSGGTAVNSGVTVNTNTGALTARAGSGITAPTAFYIEDWSALFWRVTVVATNNASGNTSFGAYLSPAVNSDASATWNVSTTGSCVAEQCDVNIGASTPSSPIITGASAVTRAAETLTIAAAKMSYNSSAMWLQLQGEINYVDGGAAGQENLVRWVADGNNQIAIRVDTNGAFTGAITVVQAESGTLDTVTLSSSEYIPGLNVPFNVASRNTSGAVNVAKDGTAGTANTTPTALPDLSAADLNLGFRFMGHIMLFRQGIGDPEDVGIAEATQ